MMITPADELTTKIRNALCQYFNRRDFTINEIASLEFSEVARLPRIGETGLRQIRCLLRKHGLDLRNPPKQQGKPPKVVRRQHINRAIKSLERRGYQIIPPQIGADQ